MVEEFIIKLEDGREIKVKRRVLKAKFPEEKTNELINTLKSSTIDELLLKMTEQLVTMRINDANN